MSAIENFIEFLTAVEKQWSNFGISTSAKENFDALEIAEFNKLVKMTLIAHLDFRITILGNPEIDKLKGNIKIIISSLHLKNELAHSLNIALNTDKWDSMFGMALLSGKLIGNPSKLCIMEKKLQSESDDVIKARLDSLLHLLQTTKNDEDTGQMALNVYESYRKMLLRDVRFQCKFSREATETLIKNYLLLLCQRKQNDHLSSAIKLFPFHRKFKFVCDLVEEIKTEACAIHLAEGFLEDLLQREFRKGKRLQDVRNLSLYISKTLEIASDPAAGKHFNLEKLLLSANTEVMGEYYYLVASHLRLQMPNSYNLVLKIISIGLSHDLSLLEQLKYATSDRFEMRREEYRTTCRRIFLALVTLGYMITNYTVRVLCFQAAKTCEVDTNYCAQLLEHLPESENPAMDEENLDATLLDIRYQLETFQPDIRNNMNLPANFEKSSNAIYDTLTYFNRKVVLSENLRPLEYPGVEKHLKKQTFEDQDHISQTSDLDKCLRDIDTFNADLSSRFKKMRHFFSSAELPLRRKKPPSNEEIQRKCIDIFISSGYFKIINSIGMFGEAFTVTLQELLVESYESYRKRLSDAVNKCEETSDNFYFDFNSDEENASIDNTECDIDALYQKGIIPVKKLFDQGLGTYDIENVLLYTIMDRKMKHISAEFEFFNKNRNVEADAEQNQVYASMIYFLNRPHPEYTRLMRLTSALMRYRTIMEYALESYFVVATPGKFKYTLKHGRVSKPKPAASPSQSIAAMEVDHSDTSSDHVKECVKAEQVVNSVSTPTTTSTESSMPEIKKEIAALIINRTKKPKPPPAVLISLNETFNVSKEILNIFYNIKRELEKLSGKDVFIDLNKVSDMSSTNYVNCLEVKESRIPIKFCRMRNGHADPREQVFEIPVPVLVVGKLVLTNEIRDEIEYDEFFDNPQIKSTSMYRLSGTLTVENLSHNVRFELECRIDKLSSKIKMIFQGVRTRPRKKPVQTVDTVQASQNGQPPRITSTTVAATSAATAAPVQSSSNGITPQSNSNTRNFNNIPLTSNSVMSSSASVYANPPQTCLPSFETMVSTSLYHPHATQHFTNNNLAATTSSSHYSFPTSSPSSSLAPSVTCPPSSAVNGILHTSIPNVPVMSTPPTHNGVNYHSQAIVSTPLPVSVPALPPLPQQQQQEYAATFGDLNNRVQADRNIATQHRTKPTIEILKVEDVSPHTRKISFGNPSIVVKEENKSPVKHMEVDSKHQTNENELVDFEAAIQNSAVIPKKIIQSSPKHPPPLHYPAPDIAHALIPKSEPIVFKCEQLRTPTKESNAKSNRNEQRPRMGPLKRTSHSNGVVSQSPATHKLTSNVIMTTTNDTNGIGKVKHEEVHVEDFIDLTDESIDLTKEVPDITTPFDVQFISCEMKPDMVYLSPVSNDKERKSSVNRGIKRVKRPLPLEEREEECRECKVHLVDIMQNINEKMLKRETTIQLTPVNVDTFAKKWTYRKERNDAIAVEAPSEEMPIEDFVDNLYDTSFTIVCHNSVSFLFNHDLLGDGIANICETRGKAYPSNLVSYTYNKAKLTNDINEIVNKFRKLHDSSSRREINQSISNGDVKILEKNLMKTLYSDKNRSNFTKNLKNRRKFMKWTPKVANSSHIGDDDKKAIVKPLFDDDENHKSLLYQVSHAVINSLPGMHSMEFFKMPSPLRRSLQIEVVHLKDIKATSSTSSLNESSDANDGIGNEPTNLHHSETINGDALSTATTIHIQKIGQTSISHETETRALQTSFGSIIKNTYPPATSRILTTEKEKLLKLSKQDESGSIRKISIGETSLKTNQNVKIIACTSSPQQQQEMVKNTNKNQTLINMLTQQVMVPTNSNRHYIITSAPKSSDMKQESGTSYTLTSSSPSSSSSQMTSANSVRKAITNAVGQSQLVQILNSPPSNFTMKSLNVITSTANATAVKSSQVATASSSPSISAVDGLKAELPNSVKQQGIVQFICKTDGKIIHLTPICQNSASGGVTKKITYKVDTSGAKGPTILHHANQQIILNNQLRKEENPNILTIIQKQGDAVASADKKTSNKSTILGISPQNNPASPISTRSIYEENYAKFIQTPSGSSNSSITTNASDMGLLTISSSPISSSSANTFIQKIGKTVIQSSNQILPKFNQAFGKSIFSSASLSDQMKSPNKVATMPNRETITRSVVNSISPVTKITAKSELKTVDGSLVNLIEGEGIEKASTLPTLQSALQGNNLLYARPIGNGKLIASNNNNVLLSALRNSNNGAATNNVRIISSLSDSMSHSNVGSNHRTIMTPVRISVPIQIPQLINSVRPQSPGNFRSQIVIAATTTSSSASGVSTNTFTSTLIRPQMSIQAQTGSKLQSLLMGVQSPSSSSASSSSSVSPPTATIMLGGNQEVEQGENSKMIVKIDQKSKKSVDNSTLEQLREFDMVLEQVLERSSVTPNSVSSPPPRPDSANRTSPRKQVPEGAKRIEIKSSSASLTSNSPNDSPTSSKSILSNGAKTAVTPKLQEDEHTAQRILDILANYKEQVRNSPDLNNKPAPRRRANPPTNPPAKRKKMANSSSSSNMKSSKQFGSSSDVMTDNTMGSEEDSSCGVGSGVASTGSMNNSPRGDIDDHTDASMDNNFYMEDVKREIASSPQSSSSSIATSPAHNKFSVNRRLLVTEAKNVNNGGNSSSSAVDSVSSKSIVISSSQSSASSASSSVTRTSSIGESIERLSAQGSTTTAVLMPGNYILPMNVLKSGQQLAILSSNNGQKIIAVPTSQLTSSASGTSIILQRYVNQIGSETAALGGKTILTQRSESEDGKKTMRLQQNLSLIGGNSGKGQQTFYVKPIENIKQEIKTEMQEATTSSSSFVSDKTLITEIIQQQQQLSHNHPQHNFMIKLNENSDPRNSSSIIEFMAADGVADSNRHYEMDNFKIKTEKIDFDGCIKEEIMDLNHDHELLNSPMLATKMEIDDNTNSNQGTSGIDGGCVADGDEYSERKQSRFPSILTSCLSKQAVGNAGADTTSGGVGRNNSKGFLIDPSSKILMYNDRRQNNSCIVDKEIFNPKSFSEECADLGVDEPIASDLFPEADLLFDSGSPKFDQINPHDGAVQIKRELENGEVLLQMNYNHNITEPWLNCFDTEDELVDDSHGESGDDASELLKTNHF